MKTKLKNQKGFTIIEVLIVLAIAGLILLIVFLAVPALQRNSRNTQRRNDVAGILGAVTEYNNNNSGTYPATGVFNTVFVNANPNSGYYTIAANITWTNNPSATAPAAPSGANALDAVAVHKFSKCSGNVSTTTGATARSVIALYNIEGSGGSVVPQCRET